MISKFLSLDQEKQDRIMNAAIQEFAQKGYDDASTNKIVKEAGISKGLLFHYFKSKKELYLFLYDHLMEILVEKLYEKLDWKETDIFNIYQQIAVLKFDLFKVYPDMVNFLKQVGLETSPEVKKEIKEKEKEALQKRYQELFSNIDFSLFKEEIDPMKTVELIQWMFEGYSFNFQEKIRSQSVEQIDSEKVLQEMDEYIAILRKTFYKS
ncbi:TetR/AcrR family transcriptional regulator [Bacillus carboniphilus]|uniref:TetR/AcrR family transcriptional regulator n=1 Tax=Bacillus carboniphilus TaxID=86663 RepID=A0ABY9JPS1_9BACI|nr:TetR/AcrR family transcriptional regulator [Bacillus carboniphilus]WLR41381.1 TetR/AcrR family transcriptional regulator [Bacillus carboniphilus]